MPSVPQKTVSFASLAYGYAYIVPARPDSVATKSIEYVNRNIFSRLSNRDLMRFDEKYIKIMLLNGLFQSNLYIPLSEREVEGGYVDIFLKRSPLLPDIPCEWLWEIKYVKESDMKTLPLVRKEAGEQLNRYLIDREMNRKNDLKSAVILFIGKDEYEIIEITSYEKVKSDRAR